jgi:hypothetical protein
MCAAAFLGQVSFTLASPAQSSGQQTSGQPSASHQNPQSANQGSSPNAQAARPSPQASKQTSGQKTQATPPSPQTGKQSTARQSQQTGQQASGQKVQAARPPAIPLGYRLLSLKEGLEIAQGIAWADDEEGLAPDCSHLVHKLYEQAGYAYPYASSLDLYRGTGLFLRVRNAHPGDLVVWRGHVGIVVSPREHSFFSTTSSGTRIQSYRAGYWRARGYPRFFRYLTKNPPKNGGASEASNRPPAP